MKELKWMLGSVYLEIVLILMQDRCTVCMEHERIKMPKRGGGELSFSKNLSNL